MTSKHAILIDGGFVRKKAQNLLGRFPTDQDIVDLCDQVSGHARLAESSLLRAFFYDCAPLSGERTNPIDGQQVRFTDSPVARRNQSLQQALALRPDFAVRTGDLVLHGWKLGSRALADIPRRSPREIKAGDLVPDVKQKGVDLRIGMDVAGIALKRLADALVFVTGDSDLVPAMKTARIEGLHVYLEHLGHPVRRDLKVHADLVLNTGWGQTP